MRLNLYSLHVEFLANFLAIMENEQARNEAILVSNILKAQLPNWRVAKIKHIPLSAAMKAGLFDENGNIKSTAKRGEQEEGVTHVTLTIDPRTSQLGQLNLDQKELSDAQKITLMSCCLVATNRVLEGQFSKIFANIDSISDTETQKRLVVIQQQMPVLALANSVKIRFEDGGTQFTADTIQSIKQRQEECNQLIREGIATEIPDTELPRELLTNQDRLPYDKIILVLDELLPCLIDSPESDTKRRERQVKLAILQLYCTILSLIREKQLPRMTDDQIAFPQSIAAIMKHIEVCLTNKTITYLELLEEINKITIEYQQDIVTFPVVKVVFETIAAININEEKNTFASINESLALLYDWLNDSYTSFARMINSRLLSEDSSTAEGTAAPTRPLLEVGQQWLTEAANEIAEFGKNLVASDPPEATPPDRAADAWQQWSSSISNAIQSGLSLFANRLLVSKSEDATQSNNTGNIQRL